MNLLELLSAELKNKKWNTEEKIRYIYIRCCELFYYDIKYHLVSSEEKEKIREREIDLEHVDDFSVVCTSVMKQVLSKLMHELLYLNVSVTGLGHKAGDVVLKEKTIHLDPTGASDLSRVKMGLSTYGYYPLDFHHTYLYLQEIDKKLGYIDSDYLDSELSAWSEKLWEDFLYYSSGKNMNSDDFTVYKIYRTMAYFEEYSFLHFADAEFCLDYFLGKSFSQFPNPVMLYSSLNEDSFVNIYPIELKRDFLYFALKKVNHDYIFLEMTRNDVLKLKRDLIGINKHLIR